MKRRRTTEAAVRPTRRWLRLTVTIVTSCGCLWNASGAVAVTSLPWWHDGRPTLRQSGGMDRDTNRDTNHDAVEGLCGRRELQRALRDNRRSWPRPAFGILRGGDSAPEDDNDNVDKEDASLEEEEGPTQITVETTATTTTVEETTTLLAESSSTPSDEDDGPTVVTSSEDDATVPEDAPTDTALLLEENNHESAAMVDLHDPGDAEDTALLRSSWTTRPEQIAHAAVLRARGKELHDAANYTRAAATFGTAAQLLTRVLDQDDEDAEAGTANDDDDSDAAETTGGATDDHSQLVDDAATLFLHQALCLLKAHDYAKAQTICTIVIEDTRAVPPAVRARAWHRRAKAALERGHVEEAMTDARHAAFLGDRKAVALYGRLMRQESGSSSSGGGGGATNNGMGAMGGSMASLMEGLAGEGGSNDPVGDGALLESMLKKSSPFGDTNDGNDAANNFLPSALLSGLGGGTGGAMQGSLAKSLLSSLSKRLDDEPTRATICRYLQSTSGPQLQSLATMAGVSLPTRAADQMAATAHRVTPKTLGRLIKAGKFSVYSVRLSRKLLKLVSKYRTLIVLWVLAAWTKSACLRPMPLNRKALRAAAKAAKRAGAAVPPPPTPATTATTGPVLLPRR